MCALCWPAPSPDLLAFCATQSLIYGAAFRGDQVVLHAAGTVDLELHTRSEHALPNCLRQSLSSIESIMTFTLAFLSDLYGTRL